MIIIFVIIFILLILLLIYYKNNIIESYISEEDNQCNNFFDKNSFCTVDLNNNTCTCKFQKDDNRYNFSSLEPCCKRKCMEIPLEECVKSNDFTKISYYCNIGGKCKKFNGTIVNSNISANHCGTDPLNNQLLLPYDSLEECSKSVDVCDKYNIPSRSVHVNKEECLKDNNCGFCTNDTGEGKCISGTESNPLDLQKYFYCTPDATTSKYKYTYGDHSAYLLQGNPTWNSP